jgi:large subunit ribosomal protein L13
MKTFSPRQSQITREWHVLDASGQTLGRLASQAAIYLCGKHKPTYAPHMDMGDHVIIVNAERVRVTGQKLKQKVYYRHSGYPGGLKSRTLEQEMAKFPNRVVERAVRGMLPRTALGNAMYRKLHVYAGHEHPHRGQTPRPSRDREGAAGAGGKTRNPNRDRGGAAGAGGRPSGEEGPIPNRDRQGASRAERNVPAKERTSDKTQKEQAT